MWGPPTGDLLLSRTCSLLIGLASTCEATYKDDKAPGRSRPSFLSRNSRERVDSGWDSDATTWAYCGCWGALQGNACGPEGPLAGLLWLRSRGFKGRASVRVVHSLPQLPQRNVRDPPLFARSADTGWAFGAPGLYQEQFSPSIGLVHSCSWSFPVPCSVPHIQSIGQGLCQRHLAPPRFLHIHWAPPLGPPLHTKLISIQFCLVLPPACHFHRPQRLGRQDSYRCGGQT